MLTELLLSNRENVNPIVIMTNHKKKTTIAIVGTGAVGGYYGAKLHAAAAGRHKVVFHMRGPNFHAATAQGLTLKSVTGDVSIPPNELNAYQSTHEMAAAVGGTGFDWVIVALKSTAMDEIPHLVAPLLSSKTRLLVIMNGLVEDALIQRLKRKGCRYRCLYGGMAFLCTERTAPAVIEHKRYGSLTAALAEESSMTASSQQDDDHEAILHELFKGTNVTLAYESSLLRGRWKKMMVNLSVCRMEPSSPALCSLLTHLFLLEKTAVQWTVRCRGRCHGGQDRREPNASVHGVYHHGRSFGDW
jgi:2-dehydropantoate 2-reductase